MPRPRRLLPLLTALLALSAPAAQAAAPVNTELPALTGPVEGLYSVLCTTGSWSGGPTSTSYRWYVDGTLISGATGRQYQTSLQQIGRSLACEVVVANADGSASARSAAVTIAKPQLRQQSPGTITGSPLVGNSISCPNGSWLPRGLTMVLRYQWIRNGAVGPVQANGGLRVGNTEAGQLSCRVTAISGYGSTIGAPTPAVSVTALTINLLKAPQAFDRYAADMKKLWLNNALECIPGSWSHTLDQKREVAWLRDGKPATKQFWTYSIDVNDVGHRISCKETVHFADIAVSATSREVLIPKRTLKATRQAKMYGYAVANGRMTCFGWEFNQPDMPVTLAWLRDGKLIPGSDYASMSFTSKDIGHRFACRASVKVGDASASTTSDAVTIKKNLYS